MQKSTFCRGTGLALFLAMFSANALAAPACKGPNKNDPGCDEPAAEEPAPTPGTPVVDSATVDCAALAATTVSSSEVEIPFDADVAAEVSTQGNYLLNVDGTDVLSIYIKSQIIDTAATGCPCEADWASDLGVLGLWGPLDTQCLEIEGLGTNDAADIAGTVLSVPNDPATYPQFPIGAAFIPGDPISSVCRLVQVEGDATTTDLVNMRINENQQATCATSLKSHICAAPP
jgi:hypothetical protein